MIENRPGSRRPGTQHEPIPLQRLPGHRGGEEQV